MCGGAFVTVPMRFAVSARIAIKPAPAAANCQPTPYWLAIQASTNMPMNAGRAVRNRLCNLVAQRLHGNANSDVPNA